MRNTVDMHQLKLVGLGGSAEWAVPVGARSRAVMFHSGVPVWYTGFHTPSDTLLKQAVCGGFETLRGYRRTP